MAAQSFLAKLGLRLSTLGSLGTLAFAFPLSEGSGDVTAQTDPTRCGFYAVAATKVATVVNGSEIFAVTTSGVHSSLAGATNEMIGTNAGNASMSGSQNALFGNGAGQHLTSGGLNTLIGGQSGNALTTGTQAVFIGQSAGAAAVSISFCTYVGAAAGAAITGDNNVALGTQALQGQTGSATANNVAVGTNALINISSGGTITAIGSYSAPNVTIGTSNIFLGYSAGDATAAGASNRFVVGSSAGPISVAYIGNGETNAAPQNVILHVTGGTGANIAGASMTLAGGISTGSAAGGSVIIQTSPKSTSSSTPNTLTTRWTVAGDGGTTWTGIATASAPALSPTNSGTIYYDSTAQAFYASVNNGAYAPLGGGGGTIGGSIAATQVAYGSASNTIAGTANLTWTAANGLNAYLGSGTGCLMLGYQAGSAGSSGNSNAFIGYAAGTGNTSGQQNVALGTSALLNNTAGNNNVFIGYKSGTTYTGPIQCVAVGSEAMQLGFSNAGPSNSVAIGFQALANAISNESNCTAVGASALVGSEGSSGYNTALGASAGSNLTTGSYNIFIGASAGDSTSITAVNHFVAGSNAAPISGAWFGNGETNAAPQNFVWHSTGGSGANVAGANVTVAGGISTGTGVGGNIIFQVSAAAGGSSSTPNTLTTIFTINSGLYAQFASAVTYPVSTKTGNYTMLSTDSTILADTTSSAFTITLMASPPTGMIVNVKMIGSGANNLTITPSSGTIDGSASLTITTLYANNQLQWNGTNWYIL